MEYRDKSKIRYNLVTALVYVIGVVLIFQLFRLQIVHGADYRTKSNTRLTRESTIKAARGDIKDSSGNQLVTTVMGFGVEIYKTKVDDDTLNNAILDLVHLLEANEDSIIDNLPLFVEPYRFKQEKAEDQEKWKKGQKIKSEASAEEAFLQLKEKYNITEENPIEARKIMAVRYEISRNGYSNTKTVTIAKNISRASQQQIREQNSKFPGITIVIEPTIQYTSRKLSFPYHRTNGSNWRRIKGKRRYL